MRIIFKLLFSLLLVSSFPSFAQQNTILIIADDVSPDYFGFYENATDTAIAPNIRSLLAKGIRFKNAWATPVCSPTRASILTGRYPFRTGVGYVISNNQSPQIDSSEMSIAKLLKKYAPQKYNTANVGKWHLNAQAPAKLNYPRALGYDFYSGNFNGAIPDYYNYVRVTNGVIDTVTTYATTQTVNDAISWMDTMNSSKPFFLWLAFNAPHTPFHKPPNSLITDTTLSGTQADITANPKKYFKASIEAMDTEIGRLFQYLNAHNLMDSTNIIFIGDNGNTNQVAQIPNITKAKGTLYDYGTHVPAIISGPSVVNPNRASDQLISTVDLFSTIVELSNFPLWKNFISAGNVVDSRSLIPILKNQIDTIRTWIFTEQLGGTDSTKDGKTIRNHDYHLIRFDNKPEEFYNLTIDSFENTNLLQTNMSANDISNYHFLCDSLTALVGAGTCQPLGTTSISSNSKISIYPNPTNDILYIDDKNHSVTLVKLYDHQGKLLLATSEKTISTQKLSPGIYTLIIINEKNEHQIEKVIKW
jgi:arylsulfatase B